MLYIIKDIHTKHTMAGLPCFTSVVHINNMSRIRHRSSEPREHARLRRRSQFSIFVIITAFALGPSAAFAGRHFLLLLCLSAETLNPGYVYNLLGSCPLFGFCALSLASPSHLKASNPPTKHVVLKRFVWVLIQRFGGPGSYPNASSMNDHLEKV